MPGTNDRRRNAPKAAAQSEGNGGGLELVTTQALGDGESREGEGAEGQTGVTSAYGAAAGERIRKLEGMLPRYYFTVTSELEALRVKRSDASGPRGARIHVTYGKGSGVSTKPGDYRDSWQYELLPGVDEPELVEGANEVAWRKRRWNGIEGEVVSGADFLLARLDGVLELDGRVTIRARDKTLIDATYWGVVDLARDWVVPGQGGNQAPGGDRAGGDRDPNPNEAAVSKAYLDFVTGQVSGDLRVSLCIRFETNTGPWASSAEAEDTAWTKKSRLKHEKTVWKYTDLVRQQFYGIGIIRLERDQNGPTMPKKIEIDVVAPSFDWRRP